MSAQKYIKQPLISNYLQKYIEDELRKIEIAHNSLVPLYKVKPADTSIANSAAVALDPDLQLNLTPGVWDITVLTEAYCAVSGVNLHIVGEFTGTLSPAPSATLGQQLDQNLRVYTPITGVAAITNFILGSNSKRSILFVGILNVLTEGIFQIYWAQQTSNVSPTIMKAGSYISARGVRI